jgi:uncharacterized protein (DUF1015 family)
MATVRPFRGYRYNSQTMALESVLTQPYDKISPEMQEHYYLASHFNLIPVEKGRSLPGDTQEENVYTRAAGKLRQWISEGTIQSEREPVLYVYSEEFAIPGSAQRTTRTGFIGLGRIEDYEAHIVFRHEQTLSGPKADRIELLRRTGTQTGQLFVLYQDPARRVDQLLASVMNQAPAAQLTDEYGVQHRLWPILETALVKQITQAMTEQKLVIADGHHRYETALTFRNECRARLVAPDPNAPHEFAMMTFVNSHGPGLVILPTHRVLAGLPSFDAGQLEMRLAPWFTSEWLESPKTVESLEEFLRALEARAGEHTIAMASAGGFRLFTLRADADLAVALPEYSPAQRQLDVLLLHRLILERGLGITREAVVRESHLTYERDPRTAISAVQSGNAQAAFLLNPVKVTQVAEIALSGGVLPQKSTDFYPKLLSGLVMYRMTEEKG